MGLSYTHILEQKILENWGLLLNDLASHWLFYRARPSQDIKINNPVWENWPENISRRRDFYYVNPKTTPILGPVVARAPLEANSSFPISTPRPISPYQLDTIPEVDIPTPHCESETISSPLSSLPLLSTPLSVRSRVLQPEQDISHADYNHEFQPEIDPFLEFKSPSQIKTKGRSPGAKNKRSSVEAGLGENSTRRDLSRFEHNVDQTSQIGVEHDRVTRSRRVNRTNRGGRASRAGRSGRVGRANRDRRISRTIGGGRVGRVGRARTRVEEVGIAETD